MPPPEIRSGGAARHAFSLMRQWQCQSDSSAIPVLVSSECPELTEVYPQNRTPTDVQFASVADLCGIVMQQASAAPGGHAAGSGSMLSARAHAAMLSAVNSWSKLKCAGWFGEPVTFAGYSDRISEPSKSLEFHWSFAR